jgi:hypothetical protein
MEWQRTSTDAEVFRRARGHGLGDGKVDEAGGDAFVLDAEHDHVLGHDRSDDVAVREGEGAAWVGG